MISNRNNCEYSVWITAITMQPYKQCKISQSLRRLSNKELFINAFLSEQFTLASNHTVDEVLHLLSQMVMPAGVFKWWRTSPNTKPYEGQIEHSQFHIRRVFQHRNDMSPYIDGNIVPSGSGSVLDVTIYAPRGVRLLLFWIILLTTIIGVVVVTVRVNIGTLDLLSFVPFTAAILTYVGAYLAYRDEANRAKAFLRHISAAIPTDMVSHAP